MPKAKLVIHRRVVEPDGSLVEIKVWQVPKNPRQPHGFKYSLVYIVDGQRILATTMRTVETIDRYGRKDIPTLSVPRLPLWKTSCEI